MDAAEQACLHPGGLELTARLMDGASLPAGATVLDAGCGAGQTVDWLIKNGFDAYGIDRNPMQTGSRVQQGDLRQLSYQPERFDAVISECTAFICCDTPKMLQECCRVLKQDGWLLLSDVYFDETKPLPQFHDGRPVTMGQWRHLLAQCGFQVQVVEDASAFWKPFVLEQLWAGRTLEELWGAVCPDLGQNACGGYKPGYFLLWARKQC